METTEIPRFEDSVRGWLSGRLPEGLYDGPLDVTIDREEITVVGPINEPSLGGDVSDEERSAAVAGRVGEFRERTREARMAVAREAEHRFGRKVAWGVDCGQRRQLFTTLSVPVMTRLRQPERQILDTLVQSGVARSRSEALAWCVRLIGKNAETWLRDLRAAVQQVERVRETGPEA
ncbi:MAG: hypothetical protein ACRDPT_09755 [Streptomycetales bacterium]